MHTEHIQGVCKNMNLIQFAGDILIRTFSDSHGYGVHLVMNMLLGRYFRSNMKYDRKQFVVMRLSSNPIAIILAVT